MSTPTLEELNAATGMYEMLKLLRDSAKSEARAARLQPSQRATAARFAKQLEKKVADAFAWLAFWAERLDANGHPIATEGAPIEPRALRGVP